MKLLASQATSSTRTAASTSSLVTQPVRKRKAVEIDVGDLPEVGVAKKSKGSVNAQRV